MQDKEETRNKETSKKRKYEKPVIRDIDLSFLSLEL